MLSIKGMLGAISLPVVVHSHPQMVLVMLVEAVAVDLVDVEADVGLIETTVEAFSAF